MFELKLIFVGVDDVLTQAIWTIYFLKEQEYDIRDNIIYQYNQRAFKLENIGRWESIMWIIHINIRYYFITNRITKEKAYVDFYPTLDMLGFYFTKTLQGSQFRYFCHIFIVVHKYDIPSYNMPVIEFIEELKIKLKNEKEEAQKDAKLVGDWGN